MKKFMLLAVIVTLVVGCASMSWTPEEEAWVKEVEKQPLTFNVHKDKDKEAWSRAQGFVSKYTSMKIQNTSENNIETYNPTNSKNQYGFNYGYKVSRLPMGDSTEYTVVCQSDNMFDGGGTRNAHIMAYYIVNGTIKYPKIISK